MFTAKNWTLCDICVVEIFFGGNFCSSCAGCKVILRPSPLLKNILGIFFAGTDLTLSTPTPEFSFRLFSEFIHVFPRFFNGICRCTPPPAPPPPPRRKEANSIFQYFQVGNLQKSSKSWVTFSASWKS
jgi:hypothetical protein